MTSNQIAYHSLQETKKHNRQDEEIRREANRITESLGVRNAAVNERNAYTNEGKLQEDARSHRANESLGYLNYARQASEIPAKYLSAYGAFLSAHAGLNQSEAALQNAATNAGMLYETHRTNLVNEGIKQQQQDEYERNNIRQFNLNNLKAVTDYAVSKTGANTRQQELDESIRHSKVVENETKRNNLYNQMLEATRQQETINRDKYNALSNFLNVSNNTLRNLTNYGG
nr:putative ORF1 [Marmot picobirnavirus]